MNLGSEEPLEALASEHFPATHGFTSRVRGRQRDALSFGLRDQSDADLELLERAVGAPVLHSLRQVHGDRVHRAAAQGRHSAPPAADALVIRTPGAAAAIKAADCVPVLLADPVTGAVAGAHAGWRGTVVRVVEKAARALAAEAGAPASRLAAVIGPSIGACCFEVGPEVVSAFAGSGHDVGRFAIHPPDRERPHLDLPLANRLQLLAAGLREESIRDAGLCTRCQPAFHSYRREGPGVGRNWSVVVAAGPAAGNSASRPEGKCERGAAAPRSQEGNDESELAAACRRHAREFRFAARSAGRFGIAAYPKTPEGRVHQQPGGGPGSGSLYATESSASRIWPAHRLSGRFDGGSSNGQKNNGSELCSLPA